MVISLGQQLLVVSCDRSILHQVGFATQLDCSSARGVAMFHVWMSSLLLTFHLSSQRIGISIVSVALSVRGVSRCLAALLISSVPGRYPAPLPILAQSAFAHRFSQNFGCSDFPPYNILVIGRPSEICKDGDSVSDFMKRVKRIIIF